MNRWAILFVGIVVWLVYGIFVVYREAPALQAEIQAAANGKLQNSGQGWARAVADGQFLTVTGVAPSEQDQAKALALALRALEWPGGTWSGAAIAVTDRTTLLPLKSPFAWSVIRAEDDGGVTIAGAVPSDTARQAILAHARALFPRGVVDRMELARGVPTGDWQASARFALDRIAQLRKGDAALSNTQLVVRGEVDEVADANAIADAVRRIGVAGFTGSGEIRGRLPPPRVPYVWSAVREIDDGAVTLSGVVPSEEIRRALLERARALFSAGVNDRMEVARGVPGGDWQATARFAIERLASFRRGSAELAGTQLGLRGEIDEISEVERATASARNLGVASYTANADIRGRLAPPRVPYVWSAARTEDDGGVTLSGYVPSEQARQAIVAHARTLFARGVVDRLEVARGVPTGDWLGTTRFALDRLASLRKGEASLNNNALTMRGETDEIADADRAAGAVRGLSIAGYTTTASIRGRLPAPRVPYVWSAARTEDDGGVTLSGYVPSEQARQSIVAHARALFARGVVDRLEVARGVPTGDWLGTTRFALDRLASLKQGEASLNNNALTVRGETDEIADADRAAGAVRGLAIAGYAAGAAIRGRLPAPRVPYVWSAARTEDDGGVTLSGYVPSEQARQAIVAHARSVFDRGTVDRMEIARGVPAGDWAGAARFALDRLSLLRRGEATLDNSALTVRGETDEVADADAYANVVRRMAIPGYSSAAEIRGRLAPPRRPYVWLAERGLPAGPVTLSGAVPNEDTRRTLVAYAQRLFPNVIDRLEIARGVPPGAWEVIARGGLDRLAALLNGNVRLEDRSLTVTGNAVDDDVAEEIHIAAQTMTSSGFAVEAKVEAPVVPLRTVDECQQRFNQRLDRGKIEFDTGSARIKDDSRALLDSLVRVAKRCTQFRLSIDGHTDNVGNPQSNLRLSEQRAQSVVNFLVTNGIDAARVTASGYGESKPIESNDTDAGRARNRRVEFNVAN